MNNSSKALSIATPNVHPANRHSLPYPKMMLHPSYIVIINNIS